MRVRWASQAQLINLHATRSSSSSFEHSEAFCYSRSIRRRLLRHVVARNDVTIGAWLEQLVCKTHPVALPEFLHAETVVLGAMVLDLDSAHQCRKAPDGRPVEIVHQAV